MTEPRSARHPLDEADHDDGPALTSADVAAAAGVTLEQAQRLWRALGFPDAGDQAAFDGADLGALSTLVGSVESGAIDFDTAVRLTRAVGQTMSRLADWQVATLSARVEQPEPGAEADQGAGGAMRIADPVGLSFEKLLIYAWRRHLAAAVGRTEALAEAEADLHGTEVTVGFADLVSFTALSNQIDEDRLGDLVEIFESRCADVIAGHHGRLIKTLGDSVLFVTEKPVQAMEIALQIIEVIGRDRRLPDVRIGLATGSVVTRLGDVFGPPVNLAARLTAVARRNRVIADAATAGMLPSHEYDARPLPGRPLRGFGVVEPIAVRRH